jgi:eukaryotic-like serine/threonine-protein kinase
MAVRKVGTSRVVREIGRGGMSVVFEGYQEALDRRVAVKALDAPSARSEELAERFRREGRAYAQIHHAGVIAVHDLVEKDGALYLVTEFVDGADLDRLVRLGRLPPACVAALGAAVAEALDCIHAHSLLHRDLKPGNVMISRRGEVKVMDFGIVKDPMAAELTRTGTVVGTPYYLAPEVLGGDGEDERSDLWSLGVTLYELATGERPFAGADYQALFGAIRRGRFRPVRELAPEVPRRLARAIERCLEQRPDRRFETAAMLAGELGAQAGRLLGEVPAAQRLAALLEERERAETAAPGTLLLGTDDLIPLSGAEADAVRHPWRRPLLWGALAAALTVWAWLSRPW